MKQLLKKAKEKKDKKAVLALENENRRMRKKLADIRKDLSDILKNLPE